MPTSRNIPVSANGKRVTTISQTHYEIHEQEMFYFSHSLARNDAEVLEILFRTSGSRKLAHMEFDFSSLLSGSWEIFEGTEKTYQSGNALTIFNRFRPSRNTPQDDIQVCHTPGAGADGTSLDDGFTGSGIGPQAPGGQDRSEGELILKPGVQYLLRLTSNANSNVCKILGQFYEHLELGDILTTTTTSSTTTTTA